jgi:hypothetical protein
MTAGKNWFPGTRKEKHEMIRQTAAFMSTSDNRDRIGFERLSANGIWYDAIFVPRLTDYFAAWNVWADPATGTVLALDNLKDTEQALFPLYRRFRATLKGSLLVSNADLEAMGFPPRGTGKRSPHPVDRLFINLGVIPVGNLVLNVAFENRDTGSSTRPYYLTGAVVYYTLSPTPIVNANELAGSRLATRSPCRLAFEPEQRGKTVYLAARWQNRRGELGPWSEIVSAIVP